MELSLTPPEKAQWRGASSPQRQAWANQVFIRHPRLNRAIKTISERAARCQQVGRGDGIFIRGEPGTGKTRLIRYLNQLYRVRPEDERDDRTLRPFVSVRVPDPCTRKRVIVEVLRSIGVPDPNSGSYHESMARAKVLIHECQVQVVTIDDLQDVPARRSARGILDIGLCFRDLIDDTSALYVFCGTKDAQIVIDGDTQLRRRVPCRLALEYFDLEARERRPEFKRLMLELDRWLPLAEESCITSSTSMERMFFASGGIVQYMIELLDHAWPRAVADGRERIEETDLQNAYGSLFGDASSTNPFSAGAVLRPLSQPGEVFHGWR